MLNIKIKYFFRIFEKYQLFFYLAVFLILVIIFYPKYYLIIDEHHIARTSYLLANNFTTKVYDPLYSTIFNIASDGAYSSKYPIGLPLLLAPLMKLGFDYIFLLNIILHIAAFYCFYLILEKKSIPRIYSTLYLLYPFFVYYSFTLFADYSAASLLMIYSYFHLYSKNKYRGYILGLIASIMLFIRPLIMIFIPFFYIGNIIEVLKNFSNKFSKNLYQKKSLELNISNKQIFQASAIFIPLLIIFLAIFFKNILVGYAASDVGDNLTIFDNKEPLFDFFRYLFYQIIGLSIFFPLMLLIIFKNIKKHYVWAVIFYIFFFSFVDYTGNVTKITSPYNLVRNIRYLMPAIILLLPDYCFELDKFIRKIFKKETAIKSAIAVILVLLILSSALLLYLHNQATSRNRIFVDDIYSNTAQEGLIVSNTLAMFLQDSFGDRKYLGFDDYGNTVDGKFLQSLPGHNISLDYIIENIEKYPSYIAITKSKNINDFNSTNENLQFLIKRYNGKLIYNKDYSCNRCLGAVDTISVSLYKLDESGKGKK